MGSMWRLLSLCVCLAAAAAAAARGAACPLEPARAGGAPPVPKAPGDNFYRLLVNGEVERYAPNQRYIVTLVGSRTADVVQQFTRFKITLEPLHATGSARGRAFAQGQFQLFADTLTRFDEECLNSVLEADDLPKTEVQVMWKAPPAGSGCVLLKAMVMENNTRWFAADGQLTKRVCEDTALSAPDCCACDDAKYKFVFEGLWSPQTHPKDFPTQALWLTHFSDVIAATHPKNFSFWGEGLIASDGFRSLAEWGSVGLMERELQQQRGTLRSIVKAPGLWHPRVNSNTTAAFSVDRKRHLLSLASMFGPSPDWVVGVSGLELCQKDCSWVQSKVIDLYPYDAGTDSGISYMSPNVETVPRERMYRITPMYPEDPRAPFYEPGAEEVAPLARLHVLRTELVSRSCSEDVLLQQVADLQEDTQASEKPECAVSAWSAWSACSVPCGKGLRMRTRTYRMPQKAQMFLCDRQLVSKEMCVAAVAECEGDKAREAAEPAGAADPGGVCETSDWGPWSECSVTCGLGLSTRRRHFHHPMGAKKCPLVQTEDNRKCMEPQCREEDSPTDVSDPTCPTTEWVGWSPCSASCGQGVRFRTRLLLVPAERQQECSSKTELMQQRPCTERQDCTLDMLTAKRICMEAPEQGPCRGLYQRWAFAAQKGMCVPFYYGGCRGTRNNFLTQEECMNTCKVVLGALGGASPASGAGAASATPLPNSISGAVKGPECEYSAWSDWSRCSAPACGMGVQTKERTILVSNQYLVYSTGAVKGPECEYSAWSDWSRCSAPACGMGVQTKERTILVSNQYLVYSTGAVKGPECEYSAWSDWSRCSAPACGMGVQTKERTILVSNQYLVYSTGAVKGPECEYSAWSDWSRCSAPACGMGVQTKERTILVQAGAGGAPCDRPLSRRRRCLRRC